MAEQVNHPEHYGGDTTYEVIKVIEAWNLDFHLGSAAKYIARAGRKCPAKTVEDLEKARWYIDRKIAHAQAASVRELSPPKPPDGGAEPNKEDADA